jgi:CheY-like chemotaxis protein
MTDDELTVLLVDDDDVAAETVIRNLHKHRVPCRVVPAGNGRAALAALRGEDPKRIVKKPFVTLLDLEMPEMSGFEFLHEVRQDPTLHDAVIYVLTRSDSAADRARAQRGNVAGYLLKDEVAQHFDRLAELLTDYGSAARLS